MGTAIVRGCIAARVFQPREVIVADVDQAKLATIAELGCAITVDATQAAQAQQILLAVKPQVFAAVAREISPWAASKVVLSIMAGLNSSVIRGALGETARVVRAMPNLPCQIGLGMTAIALGAGAQSGDEDIALSIFNALGRTVMIDESMMYAATAVSGSGPAYVFLLAEAMEQAAKELGFDQPAARLMVEQTLVGAAQLLRGSGRGVGGAVELRRAVTSPGGTTAAALSVFERRRWVDAVIEALTAARDRGRELDQS